jgi:hypothetical protein
MAFPSTILDLRAELNLAGVWSDISTYVYNRAPAIVTRGHPDESTVTVPSSASLTLDNTTARFSPRNPVGAYYGSLSRNTQLRLSLPEGASYLRLAADQVSYASAPDTAGLSITGDTEVQLDVTLDNWRAGTNLAGKWASTGNQRSWILQLNEAGTLKFSWSPDGTIGAAVAATSTLAVPVPGLRRQAIKVTLATATGTVKFWTAATIGGSYTQLGATVVAGAAAVFDSTAAVQLGYITDITGSFPGMYGKIHAFKLLSGIGGTVKASPDFTIQSAGATSFADAQSNTWTVQGTAEISDRKYRAHLEVPAWPPQQDNTGSDVYTPIQASGILRRLQAGTAPPLHSALRRGLKFATGSTAPIAYWPCEDGAGSASIASGLPGGRPMRVTGTPTFASYAGFTASSPIPLVSNSEWRGTIPQHSADTANVVRWIARVPAGGWTNGANLVSLHTDGAWSRADVFWNTPGAGADIQAFDANGAPVAASIAGDLAISGRVLMSLELVPSGGSMVLTLYAMTQAGVITSVTSTVAATALGNGTRITVGVTPGGGQHVDDTAIGHIWYQGATDSLSGYLSLLSAWAGEAAGTRFSRLCSEQGVPFRSVGSLSDTVPMGVQTQLQFTALLQECADADRGMMYEPRQAFALGYRTRRSLESQAAAVTLSYTAAQLSQPLAPTDDDQQIANDVTVTRAYGGSSSSRQVLTSGALSTAAPPNGVGPYAITPSLNLGYDSQLDDAAGWLLRLGTVDELRWPSIGVDLSRPQLAGVFYDLQELDLGDRLAVTGTPAHWPPDGISQLVQGLTEVLAGYTAGNSPFGISWQCVPESPYQTAVADDPLYAQADTDGSTLAANLTSGATSMSVATTAGKPTALWTTAGANVPFDVLMGGERITVTAISGSSSPQTFTITRSVNGVVKAHTTGEPVILFYPAIASL